MSAPYRRRIAIPLWTPSSDAKRICWRSPGKIAGNDDAGSLIRCEERSTHKGRSSVAFPPSLECRQGIRCAASRRTRTECSRDFRAGSTRFTPIARSANPAGHRYGIFRAQPSRVATADRCRTTASFRIGLASCGRLRSGSRLSDYANSVGCSRVLICDRSRTKGACLASPTLHRCREFQIP